MKRQYRSKSNKFKIKEPTQGPSNIAYKFDSNQIISQDDFDFNLTPTQIPNTLRPGPSNIGQKFESTQIISQDDFDFDLTQTQETIITLKVAKKKNGTKNPQKIKLTRES